jgi:hypothetical protein
MNQVQVITFLNFDGKKYYWVKTLHGKSEAEKIKKAYKKTGNLVRIVPSGIRGWYKIYVFLFKIRKLS